MRLEALTVGTGAGTAPFTGFVHSVFTRACNIVQHDDRSLLTLAARDVGALPRGIQLATPSGFTFLAHVRRGTPVACRGGIIRIQDSTLSVDTRSARPWSASSTNYVLDFSVENVVRAWETAYLMLRKQRGKIGLPPHASATIAALSHAVRMRDSAAAAATAAALVGLGEGLTPSGDDFLVGFLAALRQGAGSEAARQTFLRALCNAIAATAFRTSAISRSYLEAATNGEVSEFLAAFIACIARGDAPRAVIISARAVFAIGASSGIAAVFGFLVGAWAWDAINSLASYDMKEVATI